MMESVYYLDEMMRFEQKNIEKRAKSSWKYADWERKATEKETKKKTKKKTSAATLASKKIDC